MWCFLSILDDYLMIIIFLLEVIGYLYLFFQFLLQKTKKKQKKKWRRRSRKENDSTTKNRLFWVIFGHKNDSNCFKSFF
jgi:hypothetical protein